MSLKLIAPRRGKSPNWTVRGTYLGVYVDKTCGTHERPVARTILANLKRKIERGEYPPPEPSAQPEAPTFLTAAVSYLEAGRSPRYVARLVRHFGETPLVTIDQAAIDAAAVALHPNATPATRNTCVYTKTVAILRHAGIDIKVKRPKGAKGRVVTDYLMPQDAFTIIASAEEFDAELALLLKFLLYTGVRLGEALALTWDDISLEERSARIRQSKNEDPRELRLRDDLCDALKAHRKPHGRVFRFQQGGWLKHLLVRAKLAACGLPAGHRPRKGERRRLPPYRLSWVNFHTFRHTWASWMRRYGGADLQALVATGNWRDLRSASRYAHAVARDEWQRVDQLPAFGDNVTKSGRSA
jgi:integrase